MKVEDIAKICHEANRVLQQIQNDPTIPVSGPWSETSDEIQESAILGVIGVLRGNTPEQSHEGWRELKYAYGWVVGPIKSEEHKTHPLLIPYAELSADAKLKDALFSAIVKTCRDALEV